MKPIIEAKNISKKYLISHRQKQAYNTLVETLSNKAKELLSFRKKEEKSKRELEEVEEFFALKEVHFEVEPGDRVALIGRNGAGKSTLLKILSRITEPTSGEIKIRGRVSSLLEVGTGFHQELTGRENIYLNGAILGMSKQEISKKFDQIVDFAEIEKFLDTPVKRYSSGMHMRLGFAIAAHLDPDLLIVDEVLAVGDARFQEKCLSKLDSLSEHGRTVLFVSHDMGAVARLCNKGIFLENGQVKQSGPIEETINTYIKTSMQHTLAWGGNLGDEHIRFYKVSLMNTEPSRDFFYQDETIKVNLEYEVLMPSDDALVVGIDIWNTRGQHIARTLSSDNKTLITALSRLGKHKVSFKIPPGLFYEGDYLIKPTCFIHNKKVVLKDEIIIKLPIYPPKDYERFLNLRSAAAIYLGNDWKEE